MRNTPHLQLFLHKICRNSDLSGEEQQALLNLPATIGYARANRDIVQLGDTPTHACMVAHGLVARFDQNAAGLRQITAFHVPGDMPDLQSVVLEKAGAALHALSPVTLAFIPHSAIRSVVARYPAIAEAFWRQAVLDAALFAQWIVNIGRRDARTRMAHLLCEMAVRLGAEIADNRTSYQFHITQAHLADATGLTPVHVNRTLMALKADGLVTMSQRMVMIADWRGLVAQGDFSPDYLHVDASPEQRLRILSPA